MQTESATSLGDESGALPTVYSSKLLGGVRMAMWGLFTAVVTPVQRLMQIIKHPLMKKIPGFYLRKVTKIFGLKVVIKGAPTSHTPTLFVSNHTSYLDIIVLGGLVPGFFVAKAEISRWPLFGWLGRLQGTIYIERKKSEAGGQKNKMADVLNAGANLILFPEGTTGDGVHLLPFKSSLFGVAGENVAGLKIQPVSLNYSHIDGLVTGRHLKPLISWYGDMTMMGHMLMLLGLGQIQATVTFHEPIAVETDSNRKVLAQQAFEAVSAGIF
jgi:1-acyl-sn-glycerol-3-phosphate acyltransferase